MANPRNTVDFTDIGILTATYLIDNSTIVYDATAAGGASATMIGKAVNLSADKTVRLVADAQTVHGKLLLVEADNKATVQVGGYMTLPGGASATLTADTKIVGALGAASAKGYIRSVAAATLAEVAVAVGKIVDAGTTTAVVVKL